MVANRAVGSTTSCNRLSATQKEVKKEMFGPAESHLNKQIHFSPIKESSIHTKLDEIRDVVKTNQKRKQEMTTPQSEFTKKRKPEKLYLSDEEEDVQFQCETVNLSEQNEQAPDAELNEQAQNMTKKDDHSKVKTINKMNKDRKHVKEMTKQQNT